MFGKLFKSTAKRNEAGQELPNPDVSRVLKPSARQGGRPDDSVGGPEEKNVPAEPEPATQGAAELRATVAGDAWLKRDVAALKEAFDTYAERVSSRDARRQLFIASHNLRGTAGPFGNPTLERIAGSLCQLLEKTDVNEPVIALANLHVEAMRAALVVGTGAAGDELAQVVCVALEDQVKTRVS